MTALVQGLRLLLLAVLGAASLAGEHGIATRFGDPGDLAAGAELSCTGSPMRPGELACAHRTLPCGTVVIVENVRTGRFGMCQVLDRGPFGAILPSGRKILKTRRSQPGIWRGIIDLAPAVANAIGLHGRGSVRLFYERAGGPPDRGPLSAR